MNNILLLNYNYKFKKINFSFSNIKIFLVVFLAFNSMLPYFLWGKGVLICCICLLLFFVQLMQFIYDRKSRFIKYDKTFVILICSWLILYAYRYIIREASFKNIIIGLLVNFLPVLILLLSTENEKKKILDLFFNLIAVILFISLIEYGLVMLRILEINPTKIYFPGNDFYEYFENYGFFIVVKDTRNFFLPRFQSIFVEPGQLGMMCTLMLYGMKYDFRNKKVIVVLIATILTMSLASFVLLIVGIFLFKFWNSRHKSIMFVVLGIVAGLLILISFEYYKANPSSPFSTAILSRLMPDGKRGIKGNNRNTEEFKRVYSEQMETWDANFFFGYGSDALEKKLSTSGGNASATVYIFQFGVFGLFLLLFFYGSIIYLQPSNIGIGYLFLFAVSFLQRPYALWFSQIVLMYCGCSKFVEKKEK